MSTKITLEQIHSRLINLEDKQACTSTTVDTLANKELNRLEVSQEDYRRGFAIEQSVKLLSFLKGGTRFADCLKLVDHYMQTGEILQEEERGPEK